jgi:hypothetical protein
MHWKRKRSSGRKKRPLETQKATAMVAFVFLVLWLEVVLFPV